MKPLALIPAAILAAHAPHAHAQQFTPLGFLTGGVESHATGVSADGSIVVGDCRIPNAFHATRWIGGGSPENLGHITGQPSASAHGISADGAIVVGATNTALGRAFTWTAALGIQPLPVPPTSGGSVAFAISADGSTIVGHEYPPAGDVLAVRWVGGVMLPVGDLSGGIINSTARAVSADGSVIVGDSDSANGREAFRWTQAGGMQPLGDLPGGIFDSTAECVNADGSVIAGYGAAGFIAQAFRWTEAGGMQSLGAVPGTQYSYARAMSADGSVIVGRSTDGGSAHVAFLWTQPTGMLDLRAHLISLGATGLTGWTFEAASAISPDGRVICGYGRNPAGLFQAWVATLPPPPCYPNCDSSTIAPTLNVADFICFLNQFAAGASYANCDNSTLAPVLNVSDFICFLNRYGAGCG